MFLLKLPMKILALPVILVLTLVQWLGVLAAGVSSIALRLIGFAAVMTAVGIWMFQLGTNADAYRMLGFGIFSFILPYLTGVVILPVAGVNAALRAFVTD